MFYFVLAGLLIAGATALGSSAASAQEAKPRVVIKTSMGDITVELDQEKAPTTVDNFLTYVDAKHYDNTIFHRVIPDFMIQGGGMTSEMTEKEVRAPIKNESGNGLKNKRGAIAMARTSDPNSATAQFFIDVADNDFLDQGAGYAVFGEVVDGMDVVDQIVAAKTTTRRGNENVPVEPIVIESITREEKEADKP